jgi:hypothetical protein
MTLTRHGSAPAFCFLLERIRLQAKYGVQDVQR